MNKLTDVPTKRQTTKRILVLLTLAIAGTGAVFYYLIKPPAVVK